MRVRSVIRSPGSIGTAEEREENLDIDRDSSFIGGMSEFARPTVVNPLSAAPADTISGGGEENGKTNTKRQEEVDFALASFPQTPGTSAMGSQRNSEVNCIYIYISLLSVCL